MDLLNQLRDMRDRQASALSSVVDPEDDRYRVLVDRAVTLIMETPDAELVRAYQRTGEGPGNPEADMLRAEIERRNSDAGCFGMISRASRKLILAGATASSPRAAPPPPLPFSPLIGPPAADVSA